MYFTRGHLTSTDSKEEIFHVKEVGVSEPQLPITSSPRINDSSEVFARQSKLFRKVRFDKLFQTPEVIFKLTSFWSVLVRNDITPVRFSISLDVYQSLHCTLHAHYKLCLYLVVLRFGRAIDHKNSSRDHQRERHR